MCGRFTLNTTGREIAQHFQLQIELPDQHRFNIAPTQRVPVVYEAEQGVGRQVGDLRWGLVPFWADDEKIGNRLINARGETAYKKPAFRAAFAKRRCLVPTTGFYEWKKLEGDKNKQPYWIHRPDRSVFAFAGLWERWTDENTGEVLETFTIITGPPNETVEPVHDRMPAIIKPEDYAFWLTPANDDKEALRELVTTPIEEDALEMWPVSRDVNSPRNDDESLIERVEEDSGPQPDLF